MLVKFRQKVLAWLRASDDYDENGNSLYANQCVEDYPMSTSTMAASSKTVNKWPPKNKRSSLGSAMPKVMESEDDISSSFRSRGIFLKIISGQGGVVVEARQFDDRNGEWHTAVHVIPESDNLAESIAHIITMQSLRG